MTDALRRPCHSRSRGEGRVVRVDPARNRVAGTWYVGKNPFPAAFAFGDIWVPVSGGTSLVRFHVG